MSKNLHILLLSLAVMASCSEKPGAPQESAPVPALPSDGIEQWVKTLPDSRVVLEQLNHVANAGAPSVKADALCGDADTVAAIEAREYKPVVVERGSGDVQAALAILRGIPETGSTFRPQHLEEIETLAASMQDAGNDVPPFAWEPADTDVLAKNLRAVGFDPTAPDANEAFVEMLRGESCAKILPRYCEYAEGVRRAHSDTAESTQKLDILLTCDLTAWASSLRLDYPQNDYKFDRVRPYVSDAEIVRIRRNVFIESLEKYGVERAFSLIAPPDPQYASLIAARKIYVDAIEAGGWPVVKPTGKVTEAVIGKKYGYVPALRARLKAEGYDVTDLESDVYDQQLKDAIILYRDLHQLNPKVVVDNTLFKNLAVPPETRLEMIDLTIQKYREAAVGSLQYYVKVNIPDFHVEVWKDGERIARHRIVVGSNKVQIDVTTKKPVPDPETLYPIHPNRTPLQTSKINEIIYLPYWNVPTRIRLEELEPKVAKNPNYYAENFYEEVNVDNPALYYVRELPNPNNSLGQVKFMFPNPHNTYLHDTPHKSAFKQSVRGMSHGCMRVQNPLALAELLLRNDGQWDAKKVKDILNADPPMQVPIELNHPVDVDVVYFNTRVDDAGPVAFLSDLYQYDAIRLGHVQLKKLPKPPGWKPPKKKK